MWAGIRVFRSACLVVLLCALSAPQLAGAEAGKRYALVIGNSSYEHAEQLANPARDAAAMAEALEALDFAVLKGIDLSRDQLERLIAGFGIFAEDADTVLLYYAGHGFQLEGKNHLVPVDAALRDTSGIAAETFVLNDVIERIHGVGRQTIVLLDACRNNPLPPGLRDGDTDGLAPLNAEDGIFIAFATQPGNVARDGHGQNSPFTRALLSHMSRPAQSLSDLMIEVRNQVRTETLERQTPWDQSSLLAQFYFNPVDEPANPAAESFMAEAASPARPSLVIGPAPQPPEKDSERAIDPGSPEERPQSARERRAEAADDPIAACDRLAASEHDPGRPEGIEPVSFVELEKQPGRAIEACRRAVDASPGRPRLQFQLGRALVAAYQDREGLDWTRKAAESGYAPAVSELGYRYHTGLGVPRDDKLAVEWWRKAADLGDARGTNNLGWSYQAGLGGLKQDYAEALRLYKLAASSGEPAATANLGMLYLQGLGVERDAQHGLELIRKAAASGDAVGLVQLGLAYANGLGELKRNNVEARRLYEEAAALGHTWAVANVVQDKLKRLGCYTAKVDGIWGPASRRALGRYYEEKGKSAEALEPNADLIAALKQESGEVCTQVAAKPPAKRSTRRAPEKKAAKSAGGQKQLGIRCRGHLYDWKKKGGSYRAFAAGAKGNCGWSGGRSSAAAASEEALKWCRKIDSDCKIIATK